MTGNIKGALLMVGSMVAFVINDSFLRLTGGNIPLFQLIFVRGLAATVLIFGLAYAMGALRHRFSGPDRLLLGLRALAEIGTAYFFLNALFNMPLGNLNAIMQVVPLTVTLGSALVFREAVGWRRMLAIVIGFCGVLLIIRPGAEGFNQWSLYALAAVLGVTLRDLVTRRLSPGASGLMVTLATTLAVTAAAGLASLTAPWGAIEARDWGFITGSAVFILMGYFFSIQVMRVGDVAFIAPFRYAGLVVAMIVGVLLFDEIPSALTMLGAAIVVGTGIFTFYRERKLSGA